MINLAKRVAILLIEQDRSEAELVKHLDMSSKGFKLSLEKKTVSFENLNKIAQFFNMSIGELSGEESEYKEKYYKNLELLNKLLEKENKDAKGYKNIEVPISGQ